jgi:uncharacterized protein YcnI
MKRTTVSAIAVTAALALVLAAPIAASAHVTIGTDRAEAGSYPLIDFRVPTESATAATSRVELTLPEDTPFGYVSYVPVAGWTTEIVTTPLSTPVVTDDGEVTDAVTKVIWTADPGSEITAEQYGVFPIKLGPVPDTGSVLLAVEQTYTDGSVVSWDEAGEDAEHPAPVLYVNDAPPADGHSHSEGASVAHDEAAAPASGDVLTQDVLARILGISGIIVGVVAIVLAVTARRRASS